MSLLFRLVSGSLTVYSELHEQYAQSLSIQNPLHICHASYLA
uniref:Uncharacterized protein n=1 Tax=Arundo donax TaxID=35708 RepID=A0A0A9DBY7_ARUDO